MILVKKISLLVPLKRGRFFIQRLFVAFMPLAQLDKLCMQSLIRKCSPNSQVLAPTALRKVIIHTIMNVQYITITI